MLRKIIDGFFAGLLVGIGGCVYLALYEENRIVGAILFAIALLVICYNGYSLFTGKIGLIPEHYTKEDISVLLLGLFGNAAGAVLCGYLLGYALPALNPTALLICSAKLEQSFGIALVRAAFCGILMYLAVDLFKRHKTNVGIFFCIPVFILCCFEHSIANMFYFAISGIVSPEALGYIWLCILGNAIGGMLIPTLTILGGLGNADK